MRVQTPLVHYIANGRRLRWKVAWDGKSRRLRRLGKGEYRKVRTKIDGLPLRTWACEIRRNRLCSKALAFCIVCDTSILRPVSSLQLENFVETWLGGLHVVISNGISLPRACCLRSASMVAGASWRRRRICLTSTPGKKILVSAVDVGDEGLGRSAATWTCS